MGDRIVRLDTSNSDKNNEQIENKDATPSDATVENPVATPPQVVTPSEDMIRRARLAKFEQANTARTNPPIVQTEQANPAVTVRPVTSPITINTAQSRTAPIVIEKSPIKSPVKSPTKAVTPIKDAKQEFQNEIKNLFSIVLEPENSKENKYFLPNLAATIDSGINLSHIDLLLVEVLQLSKKGKTNLEYLLDCLSESKNLIRKYGRVTDKKDLFQDIHNILINYIILLFENEFFGQNLSMEVITKEFIEKLRKRYTPIVTVGNLIQQMQKEQLQATFLPIFVELRKIVSTLTIESEDLSDYLTLFKDLVSFKELAQLVTELPNFVINGNTNAIDGKMFEKQSYLGPFFSIGTFSSKSNHLKIFQDIEKQSRDQVRLNQSALREKARLVQVVLHETLLNIIKKAGKDKVLTWLGQALNCNKSLTKLQFNANTVSDDSFRLNVMGVLVLFCLPFMTDPQSIKKIEGSYLQSGIRLNIEGETQLLITTDLPAWVDKRNLDNIEKWKQANPNIKINENDLKKIETAGFTTECFFLTLRSLTTGFMPSVRTYNFLIRDKNKYDRIIQNEPAGSYRDENIKIFNFIVKQIHSLLVYLDDEKLLIYISNLYLYSCDWILHIIKSIHSEHYPNERNPQIKLPLPDANVLFASLPEFIIDDLVNYFIFLIPFDITDILNKINSLLPLLHVIILLAGSPNYVRNPYLRARLIRILTDFIECKNETLKKSLSVLLDSDRTIKENLTSVLMKLYVQIENTGSHGQFYEKFSVRRDIQIIMKFIWQINSLKQKIIFQSKNENDFLPFISMILNDAIFLLDEGLKKLHEIRALQLKMQSEEFKKMKPSERQQIQVDFERSESSVSSYFFLANETVTMLSYVTEEIVEPFMKPQVVDRVATMLNYFLDQLAGPNQSNLRVANPDKYHFKPRVILGQLVDIYLHLWTPVFVKAVANDGRSYKHQTFKNVGVIFQRTAYEVRSSHIANKFLEFANQVKEAVITSDEDIEVPDEFQDPLMSNLMNDPVKLPSGQTIDRAVIEQHFLMNGYNNPFNRQPLKQEDLVPDDELRLKIEQWKKENNYKG